MSIVSEAYSNKLSDFSLVSGNFNVSNGGSYSGTAYMLSDIIQMPSWLLIDHSYFLKLSFACSPESYVSSASVKMDCNGYKFYIMVNGQKYYLDGAKSAYFTVQDVQVDYFQFGVELTYSISMNAASSAPVSAGLGRYTFNFSDFTFDIDDLGITETVTGAIKDQTGKLQAEFAKQQELQEEANETSKNIFQKISDFFAGFFEGIINAFKSLFIPEDGYFSEYFTRLNDFFADKLGMLYAPIDMFLSVLNGFLNASASDAGIPFPGIKWGDAYFIEPHTVSITEILSDFPGLQDKIYFVTNIVMIGAVLLLLQNKLKEVLNR